MLYRSCQNSFKKKKSMKSQEKLQEFETMLFKWQFMTILMLLLFAVPINSKKTQCWLSFCKQVVVLLAFNFTSYFYMFLLPVVQKNRQIDQWGRLLKKSTAVVHKCIQNIFELHPTEVK